MMGAAAKSSVRQITLPLAASLPSGLNTSCVRRPGGEFISIGELSDSARPRTSRPAGEGDLRISPLPSGVNATILIKGSLANTIDGVPGLLSCHTLTALSLQVVATI